MQAAGSCTRTPIRHNTVPFKPLKICPRQPKSFRSKKLICLSRLERCLLGTIKEARSAKALLARAFAFNSLTKVSKVRKLRKSANFRYGNYCRSRRHPNFLQEVRVFDEWAPLLRKRQRHGKRRTFPNNAIYGNLAAVQVHTLFDDR